MAKLANGIISCSELGHLFDLQIKTSKGSTMNVTLQRYCATVILALAVLTSRCNAELKVIALMRVNGITHAKISEIAEQPSAKPKISDWIQIGGQCFGWTLIDLDVQKGEVLMRRNEKYITLMIAEGRVADNRDYRPGIAELTGMTLASELARTGNKKIKMLVNGYEEALVREVIMKRDMDIVKEAIQNAEPALRQVAEERLEKQRKIIERISSANEETRKFIETTAEATKRRIEQGR